MAMKPQDVKIVDGDTTTRQTSVIVDSTDSLNRLAVDAKIKHSPVDAVHYHVEAVQNGSSKDMNVNGSVTPVNFDYTPDTGETEYVDTINFFILDAGNMNPGRFGSLATALTNGLQILIKTEGTERELGNLKDNMDIALFFGDSGSTGLGSSGWMASSSYFSGLLRLKVAIKLQDSTSDYIRFKVRDNLANVDFLRASVLHWKVV